MIAIVAPVIIARNGETVAKPCSLADVFDITDLRNRSLNDPVLNPGQFGGTLV